MVYVDDPMPVTRNGKERFKNYCHCWADSLEELHEFVDKLGLARSSFQNRPRFPHYDLSPRKRAQAIAAGATYVKLKEWLRSNTQ